MEISKYIKYPFATGQNKKNMAKLVIYLTVTQLTLITVAIFVSITFLPTPFTTNIITLSFYFIALIVAFIISSWEQGFLLEQTKTLYLNKYNILDIFKNKSTYIKQGVVINIYRSGYTILITIPSLIIFLILKNSSFIRLTEQFLILLLFVDVVITALTYFILESQLKPILYSYYLTNKRPLQLKTLYSKEFLKHLKQVLKTQFFKNLLASLIIWGLSYTLSSLISLPINLFSITTITTLATMPNIINLLISAIAILLIQVLLSTINTIIFTTIYAELFKRYNVINT